MSGNRIVLDTNAIIELLRGLPKLEQLLSTSSWVGISVISRMEFLSFSQLSSEDEQLFDEFCKRVETIWLSSHDKELLVETTKIRRKYGVKLPDALIAATAITKNAVLVTADSDFGKVPELSIINPLKDKSP